MIKTNLSIASLFPNKIQKLAFVARAISSRTWKHVKKNKFIQSFRFLKKNSNKLRKLDAGKRSKLHSRRDASKFKVKKLLASRLNYIQSTELQGKKFPILFLSHQGGQLTMQKWSKSKETKGEAVVSTFPFKLVKRLRQVKAIWNCKTKS